MDAARVLAVLVSALSLLALTGAVASASSEGEAATGLRFSALPKHVLPGKTARVGVTGAKARDVCRLNVKYAGGAAQRGLRLLTVGPRRPSWTWKLPVGTRPGAARVSVACESAGRVSGQLVVDPLPLRIDVVKHGFSIRASSNRSTVSYGVVLANRSRSEDALDVSVLVNFVDSRNVLVGTEDTTLDSIPAGAEYRLGDSASFNGTPDLSRLEVVVRVGDRQPAVREPVPAVTNVRIAPDKREPTWVDAVLGDLTNVSRRNVLTRVQLSVVILNGAGEVIGGGTGSASGTVPPGARQFVEVDSGVEPVPSADAATALFTVVPRYESDD
jgi:hypothetical protein